MTVLEGTPPPKFVVYLGHVKRLDAAAAPCRPPAAATCRRFLLLLVLLLVSLVSIINFVCRGVELGLLMRRR